VAGTIDGALRWWGRERAEYIALSIPGDSVSYAELDAWVGRTAAFFERSGLRPGSRVCIYASNSIEWCVAALAALRVGGIVAGINARMVAAEVAHRHGRKRPPGA